VSQYSTYFRCFRVCADLHGGGFFLQAASNSTDPAYMRGLIIDLYNHCRGFTAASNWIALRQLSTTLALFLPLLALMYWLAPLENSWAFILAIPAGCLLTRLFALQHDCGHGSFFSSSWANQWVGKILSLLTFTPYDHWRRNHAAHHAASGNLANRGVGDVETLTVAEYKSRSWLGQWRYRIMRHPVIALLVGPPVYFLLLQRLPKSAITNPREFLPGILGHNAALVLFYGSLCWWLGTLNALAIVLPAALVGAWIGGFLFFVQHQFEETLWEGADQWDVKVAAIMGSSHLQLPGVLNWLTCDIGLHHIHHLMSRVPNYRLRACLSANPDLQTIAPTLSLWMALKSVHLSLWDESERRLISFGTYKTRFA
jgi:acyl-lipid omega-6 desaturase (Delta-12 desaturase)